VLDKYSKIVYTIIDTHEAAFTSITEREMNNAKSYKRKFLRAHMPFLMKILTYNHRRLDSEYCTCAEGINISPNGVSFKYPKVIRKDDHLRILIHNVNGMKKDEIVANIRVVWSESKDLLSRKFGARFVKIAPEDKYKLMKLLRKP